ncbi:MFS transporter [Novosphingobium flavum]|uniref:MFS transporter n=1 Tax=Novosphingobium flavum TaxID=1778672 RepID=A0A7X1FST5_9SPHN|nr:MFS transporter [Novosphingobium flavum]MBC2665692.1 MFS transporter [Novosphingobium flavum]
MGQESPAAAEDRESPARLLTIWAAVALLFALYVVAVVDRLLVSVLLTPIKAAFTLTDFSAGLLLGPAFGIFYGVMAFPMGWIADRFGRRLVLFVAVAIWSLASLASALVTTVAGLIVARCVVAIAEAALSPAAFALIGAMFPPRKAAFPMAVYATGSSLGFGLALLMGGHLGVIGTVEVPLIGILHRWQAGFISTAVIGLVISPLIFLLPGGGQSSEQLAEARRVKLKPFLAQNLRRIVGLLVLFGIMAIVGVSLQLWSAPHAQRMFGASAAAPMAIMGTVAAVAGSFVTGRGAVLLRQRGSANAYVLISLFVTVLALPVSALGFLSSSQAIFVGTFAFTMLLFAPFIGYAAAAFNEFTPEPLRARVGAIFFTMIAMAGSVVGPPLVGALSEGFGGAQHLGEAMATVNVVACILIAATALIIMRAKPGSGT